jgi:hypothetical protein
LQERREEESSRHLTATFLVPRDLGRAARIGATFWLVFERFFAAASPDFVSTPQ